MSAITIVPEDGTVIINGTGMSDLDMVAFNIPEDVHALQWQGVSGWIETKKPSNIPIDTLPEWAESCVSLYNNKADEIEAQISRDSDPAVTVRAKRDWLLAATDWTANSDVTMSDAMRVYRQALRDVPSQAGFPDNITWPEKP